MQKATLIGILVVIVVLGLIGAALVRKNTPASSTATATPTESSAPAGEETSSPSSSGTATPTAESNEQSVDISGFAYSPLTVTIKKGTTVVWHNLDNTAHTVTAKVKSSNAPDSPVIAGGGEYRFTFTTAGTYQYYCQFHSSMVGTVTVTE